jgi:hypothetical protein
LTLFIFGDGKGSRFKLIIEDLGDVRASGTPMIKRVVKEY